MDLRFYGGVNQIGGNKILVTDRKADARIFLDFGMNFAVHAQYFEEFIQPRTANGITDFIEIGLLPKIKGIYRRDLLEFAGLEKHEDVEVDAVILSHAHLDHAAHVSFLDERIPVYCNAITHSILQAIHETAPRRLEYEIINYKRRPLLNYKDKPIPREFRIVEGRFKIGGLEIEMIPVDHSVPGASALLIHGSDQTIAYSGDLRMHGTEGYLTEQFLERLKQAKPDIFLCEGTRIDETDRNNEQYVRDGSGQEITKARGLVMADFAFKDTTRFMTFLELAKNSGRRLLIAFKDAYYIRKLKTLIPSLPSLDDESMILYEEKRGSGTFSDRDYYWWEREFLNRQNTVRPDYVSAHQNEIIAAMGYYDVTELIDLKPTEGSIYIKSASEVINEEQEFDMKRLKAWLDHFRMGYHHFHASGHAPQADLARIMGESNSGKIIPIHTQHADMFSSLVDKPIEMPQLSME
ncbi:MAG: MBL fold metallo-hydrolase [Thaumarchaeota archaeon]|nr:MBL fold metallo-hydrolase [Nitrososphaerota archaeon]